MPLPIPLRFLFNILLQGFRKVDAGLVCQAYQHKEYISEFIRQVATDEAAAGMARYLGINEGS